MTWLDQVIPQMKCDERSLKRFESGARWKGLQLKPIEQVEFDDLWLITGVGKGTMLAFVEACQNMRIIIHGSIVRWYLRETAPRRECPLCGHKLKNQDAG